MQPLGAKFLGLGSRRQKACLCFDDPLDDGNDVLWWTGGHWLLKVVAEVKVKGEGFCFSAGS